MFKEFRIKNFRGISELKVDNLKEINVFVGDNGSCKTTILDALYILLNPNNVQLIVATNFFRNIDRIDSNFWKSYFNDFNINKRIELFAKNELSKKIILTPVFSSEKHISDKEGVQSSSELEEAVIGMNVDFDVDKKSYSARVEQNIMPMPIRQNEADFILNMVPRTILIKSQPDKNYTEKNIGHYFNSFTVKNNDDISLKFDAINEKFGKQPILDFLREMGVLITDIELSSSRRLMVRDERFSRRVSLNTYGDGILNSFNIFLSASSADQGITLIDEIENGLYWNKQEILLRTVNKIATEKKQQFFITTHSSEMLKHLFEVAKKDNFINKINLVRIEKEDNVLTPISYGQKELEYALSGNIEVR